MSASEWLQHRVRVRFAETDLMGVVHHANYLLYFEEARGQFFRAHGIAFEEFTQAGVHLAVVDVGVRYRRACRYEEWLTVRIALTDLRGARLRFDYELLGPDDDLRATGYTVLGAMAHAGHGTRLPTPLREKLAPLLAERSTEGQG